MKLAKRILSQFDVIGISGRGGYSRVYKLRCRCTSTNKLHALKEVSIVSKQNLEDILLESRAIKTRHKNILCYRSLMVSTRPKELKQVQEPSDPESRPSSGIIVDLKEKCKSFEIDVNTNKNRKYYHYLLTEYSEFTLRDYLDLRNEIIHQDVRERCILFEEYKSNKTFECKMAHNDAEGRTRHIPAIFIIYGITRFGGEKFVNRHFANFLFKGILKGLGFLHAKNITHQDIKASNIFFVEGDEYNPKIGDFGLSKKGAKTLHSKKTKDREVLNRLKNDDIISAIAIYFEMLWPFKTVAERYFALKEVKERCAFPVGFRKMFPEEHRIMLKYLDSNFKGKISARGLFREIFFLERSNY